MTKARLGPLEPPGQVRTSAMFTRCIPRLSPALGQLLKDAGNQKAAVTLQLGVIMCFCPHSGLSLLQAALWNLARKTKNVCREKSQPRYLNLSFNNRHEMGVFYPVRSYTLHPAQSLA